MVESGVAVVIGTASAERRPSTVYGWGLLRQYQEEHRVEFSNKEIRLDQTLKLPVIKDNLEAWLILLRRRLEERSEHTRIEKTTRGRFRLVVSRPLVLVASNGGGPL